MWKKLAITELFEIANPYSARLLGMEILAQIAEVWYKQLKYSLVNRCKEQPQIK